MNSAAIALNRFGLGARPDDALPADPQRWLLDQFVRYQPQPPAWAGHADTDALLSDAQEPEANVFFEDGRWLQESGDGTYQRSISCTDSHSAGSVGVWSVLRMV